MSQHEETDQSIWLRRLKIGYGSAAGLFLLSMMMFIVAIAAGSGATAGIGGVLLATSCVCGIAIAIYHALTRDEYV